MEWIPRSLNDKAYFLSKIVDTDDWKCSDEIFTMLHNVWGPYTVDRFASYYNTKLPRFNSRFWNPGSEAIDTFTENWSIPRAILHLLASKAQSTLICPAWKSAPFWVILFQDGYSPRFEISDIWEFTSPFPQLKEGRGGNSKFVQNMKRSTILAVRFQRFFSRT